MINDSLIDIAIKHGNALADECCSLNWKKLEEADAKLAEEVAQKLAEQFTQLKAERRNRSYDNDTFHARGADVLRSIVSECGGDSELINTVVKYTERAFQMRREEARMARRKMEWLRRKTRPGGHAHAAHSHQERHPIDRTKVVRHGIISRPVHIPSKRT
jgi:hypothetical protein